ncbi:hypothetical protein BDP55DRAFT_665965 [Colletotrichum godetiae]|uniref:Uncharacterized protein n=1 Tax=Colletotrichum godetiae TaxID=1209918 RepID=A0AAJ0EWY8_9PEZI|nr:uncharacterized protein BDP55DRAFT_665965 [Colletotrichum godetiae]KAK1674694.1 hypothetical protein BDP55DRAFT_665965 [Colletotrichum godetiae]
MAAAFFNFLCLPRELRDIIYKRYLAVEGGYVCDLQAFIDGKGEETMAAPSTSISHTRTGKRPKKRTAWPCASIRLHSAPLPQKACGYLPPASDLL